ncbi:DUF1573 domain-containing protein [Pontiella sp.]|uniref:DUF1573 domain-containing protein n=1 Tax=Pontiella sp. TaxID=2837462 RepID=UPI003566791C
MKTLIALCFLACAARAGLKWETTEVRLEVHPAQASASAVFRFSNAGKEAVTIGDVKVGCGCLAPQLAKRTYGPGEEGELTIRFDLGNRSGPQSKTTTVRTSDGQSVDLVVSGNLPKAYDVLPAMMRIGGTEKTKTARLVNPNPIPIRLLSATSSHKELSAELKTIREGFEYEVLITRKPAASNARAVIRIELEPPPGKSDAKILKLYAHAP